MQAQFHQEMKKTCDVSLSFVWLAVIVRSKTATLPIQPVDATDGLNI
jgi:hypothetical protein